MKTQAKVLFNVVSLALLWIALAILAVVSLRPLFGNKETSGEHADWRTYLQTYAATTFLATIAGAFAFILVSKPAGTDGHYVISLLTIAAQGGETLVIASVEKRSPRSVVRIACALGIAAISFAPSRTVSLWRMTNMDLICNVLRGAEPSDLIIVNPSFLSPSFARYYKGAAPWHTVPETADRNLEAYVMLFKPIGTPNAVSDVIRDADRTLDRGGTVFLVSDQGPIHRTDGPCINVPAAPYYNGSWKYIPYMEAWTQQLGCALAKRNVNVVGYLLSAGPTNGLERPVLFVVSPKT